MTIKNTASNNFKFELLDEFATNPESIEDIANQAGKQAKTLMIDTIESALKARINKLINLHPGPLTIEISVALGNIEDFNEED